MQKFRIETNTTKKHVNKEISALPEDGSMEVVIKKFVKDRTEEQRNGWHYLLTLLSKRNTGYRVEELKLMIKKYSMGYEYKEIDDVRYPFLRSTEKYTIKQYNALIEATYQFAVEKWNIVLPPLEKRGQK